VVCLNVSRCGSFLCWKGRKLSKRAVVYSQCGPFCRPSFGQQLSKNLFFAGGVPTFLSTLNFVLVYLILPRRTQPYSSSTPTNVYGGGRQGIFHTLPLRRFPLKRIFIVCLLQVRGFLKRGGFLLIHFQYLVSKTRSEKGGERVSYIDFARPWIFDAHGVSLGTLTK
jgi:hypothetical protein